MARQWRRHYFTLEGYSQYLRDSELKLKLTMIVFSVVVLLRKQGKSMYSKDYCRICSETNISTWIKS